MSTPFHKEQLYQNCPALRLRERTRFCQFAADSIAAGFGRSRLIQQSHLMKWGIANDRPVSNSHVTAITNSMVNIGVIKHTVESAIPLAVKQSWIDKKFDDLKDPNLLPMVQLTEEGNRALAAGEFAPYGGNHRRTARDRLAEDLQKQIAVLSNKKFMSQEQGEELAKLKCLNEELEDWSFLFYDLEAIGTFHPSVRMELSRFLARNSYLPILKEGEDESHVMELRGFQEALAQDLVNHWKSPTDAAFKLTCLEEARLFHLSSLPTAVAGRGGVPSSVRHFYQNSELVSFSTKLLKLGPHFRNCVIYKRSKVTKHVNSVYGGMAAVVLNEFLEATYRLFSKSPFPSQPVLQLDVTSDAFVGMEKQFWTLQREEGNIRFDLLTEICLEALDASFRDCRTINGRTQFGFLSAVEGTAVQDYTCQVRETLQAINNNALEPLPSLLPRFDFLQAYSIKKYGFPFPILTASVINAVIDSYETVKHSLTEVFYMLDPLSPYTRQMGQRKSNICPDQSLDVHRSITTDPRLSRALGRENAAREVFLYLTSIASTVLCHDNKSVQSYLEENPRPVSKDLITIFGTDIVKLKSKEFFALNLDEKAINLPSSKPSKSNQPYRWLVQKGDYSITNALKKLRDVLVTIHKRVSSSSEDSILRLTDCNHSDPAIRVLGATGLRFLKPKTKSVSYDDQTYKLSMCAVYESVRSERLRPKLLKTETDYLQQVRTNVAFILSQHMDRSVSGDREFYKYADFQDGDDVQQFSDLLKDAEEVKQLRCGQKKRKGDAKVYSVLDSFVSFITSYEGVQYHEACGEKHWDPQCRSAIELLIEAIGHNERVKEEGPSALFVKNEFIQHYAEALGGLKMSGEWGHRFPEDHDHGYRLPPKSLTGAYYSEGSGANKESGGSIRQEGEEVNSNEDAPTEGGEEGYNNEDAPTEEGEEDYNNEDTPTEGGEEGCNNEGAPIKEVGASSYGNKLPGNRVVPLSQSSDDGLSPPPPNQLALNAYRRKQNQGVSGEVGISGFHFTPSQQASQSAKRPRSDSDTGVGVGHKKPFQYESPIQMENEECDEEDYN